MGVLWEKLIRPGLFRLDAEWAHEIGIEAMRLGLSKLFAPPSVENELFGEITRFGLKFASPLGVAAGFDKNAVVVNRLAALGFGFVEIGTVTCHPQPGNPKPRLFRLPQDQALINRLGFNNDGAVVIAERLGKLDRKCIVGVNIGRNKDVMNDNAIENYVKCFELVRPVADYIAVNVSSPNTPNLRELQKADHLEELVGTLQAHNGVLSSNFSRQDIEANPDKAETQNRVPLLVKIAPDLDESEIESAVDICLRHQIDGIIATNTTISRKGLHTVNAEKFGDGGLSGKPLERRSNDVISLIFRRSKGKLPIIGVGGVFSADDAFAKVAAGASLIQAYTGFIYHGPSFAREINEGLAAILKRRGYKAIDDAVGCAVEE